MTCIRSKRRAFEVRLLGLKNLSIIADSLKLIDRNYGIKIDLDTMPVDDKKTFEMLLAARRETCSN